MLTMLRPGVAERIEAFVKAGGIFVATYLTGMVDQDDLCFLGGFPGPLRKVLGIWMEENDVLADGQTQDILAVPGAIPGLPGVSRARHFCDVVHLEGAEAVATYGKDYYAGTPAVTRHAFGSGSAWYLASRNEAAFHDAFTEHLIKQAKIRRVLDSDLPEGVTVQARTDGKDDFLFVMNFQPAPRSVDLGKGGVDLLTTREVSGLGELPAYGVMVIRRQR
jgi:beta-galactosidase